MMEVAHIVRVIVESIPEIQHIEHTLTVSANGLFTLALLHSGHTWARRRYRLHCIKHLHDDPKLKRRFMIRIFKRNTPIN
jgi:hypothetical protein